MRIVETLVPTWALLCAFACSHAPKEAPLLHHEVPVDRRLERILARVDPLHPVQGVFVAIRHERGAAWAFTLRNISDRDVVVHWERSTLRLVDNTAMGVLIANAKHVAPNQLLEVDITPELLAPFEADPHMWTLVRDAVFEISIEVGDGVGVWRGMVAGDSLKGPRVNEALLVRLGSKEPMTGRPSVPAPERVSRFKHHEAREP